MRGPIHVTVYRWAGRKWGLRIRSECAECDFSVAQVRSLLEAHPEWPVKLEVKPWLDYLGEALRLGGWHPPVTAVDGRMVCQGRVPAPALLESALCRALAHHGILFEAAHPGDCMTR